MAASCALLRAVSDSHGDGSQAAMRPPVEHTKLSTVRDEGVCAATDVVMVVLTGFESVFPVATRFRHG